MDTNTNAVAQVGNTTPANFVEYKNQITKAVLSKVTDLCKHGVTPPEGYNAENNVYQAMMQLSQMETKDGRPLLSVVKPQSVANAMLEMTLKGLSLAKHQCAFVRHGDQVTLQEQYQGRLARARRLGAGMPQAQVIYKGDDFAFEIDPRTARKIVIRHQQSLESIGGEIVGAWAVLPLDDGTAIVDVMTMAEIKASWMQGATKGESPAHRNFPGEMCKKTVLSRLVKLYIESAAGDSYNPAEVEDQPTVEVANAVPFEIPAAPEVTPTEVAPESPAADTESVFDV